MTDESLHCDAAQVELLRSGVSNWNAWRDENPNAKIHLANAELPRLNLAGADLRHADLRKANLLGVILIGAKLDSADLRETFLREADLTGASLSNADIRSATFSYANVANVKTIDIIYTRKSIRGKFLGVRGVESSWGDAMFKRMAADQAYLDSVQWHKGKSWQRALFCIWGWFDYGRSLTRILGLAAFLIILFGVLYTIFPETVGLDCCVGVEKCARHGKFTPFYFSVVTFTTLGFGDVAPQTTFGEIIVTVEVIFGYLSLGLLLSVLADKVARRS